MELFKKHQRNWEDIHKMKFIDVDGCWNSGCESWCCVHKSEPSLFNFIGNGSKMIFLAEELAREGAHVVLADLQLELAEEVATGINSAGGSAEAVQLDVTDAQAFAELANQVKSAQGKIDYLFNNAGIWISGGMVIR